MLIIPITACYAFGQGLVGNNPQADGSYELIYYNENFLGRIDFIYYVISLYIFLNIATFSVSVIVLRRNLLQLIDRKIKSDRLQPKTVIATILILAIILVVAFFLGSNIQVALNFTGVLAIMLLFIMPSI